MPNHVTVIALCGSTWNEEGEEFDIKKFTNEKLNLCQQVSPMPTELEGIRASNPPSRSFCKETGKQCFDEDEELRNRDKYKRVQLEPSEIAELERRFGAATWYEWCPNNWGTKWGTYSVKAYQLGGDGAPVVIEFQTAWSPPNGETMAKIDAYLKERFGFDSIAWSYFDPYDDSAKPLEFEKAAA